MGKLNRLMRVVINVTIFLIILLSSLDTFAQKNALFFKHLTSSNGLSSNRINAIIEDGEGFVWFNTGDGLNLYDGSSIEIFDKQVKGMVLDPKSKNLLVGTSNGLELFDKNTWSFKPIKLQNNLGDKLDKVKVKSLHYSTNNRLFLGADFLYVFNESLTNFAKYQLPKDDIGEKSDITSVHEIEKGNVLLGTKNGVWQLNLKTGKYNSVYKNMDLGIINKLFIDSESNLWICSYSKGILFVKKGNVASIPILYKQENGFLINNRVIDIVEDEHQVFLIANIEGGLVRFDKNKNTVSYYQPDIHNINSLSGKAITTLLKDSQNNVWIGTYNSGVDFIDRHRKKFQHFQINFKDNGLFNNNIRAFFQDSKSVIWVGTKEGGGLSKFNRSKGTFVHYKSDLKKSSSLGDDYVFCIEELDSKHLMIGTLKNGLEIFNTETETFSHNIFNEINSIFNGVYAIHKDRTGKIWIDYGGLFYEFFPQNHSIKKIDGIVRVRCIIDEDENHIWLGTIETGLFLFNTKTKELKKATLYAKEINALQKDSRGNLWVGTKEGLFLKRVNSNIFVRYTVKDGLANNQVLSLQVDSRDNVWAGTTRGLSKYNVNRKKFLNYDVHDGLQGNEFERYVSLKTNDGELLFGGRNGFNIFHPDEIKENSYAPKVVITSFNLFNKPVTIGGEDSPLSKHISQTKEFTLTNKQSVITFGFVALNYSSPEKNQYAYKLEGFDENWNYIANKRHATYTNLPAGDYVFKVKASNADGIWNNTYTSIKVTVLPPWWKSYFAYFSYFIIIIFLLVTLYYLLYTYLNLKNNLILEQIEKEKNKELLKAKTDFFTNISHEFRTPLTLIIAPLDRLLHSNHKDENLVKRLKLIDSNAKRLLRLINQLMDFRKVETGNMTLKISKYNIVKLTKKIAKSFKDKAKEASIHYKVISPNQEIFVFLDLEKYDIILHNLLFNAFKFTNNHGTILVEINLIDINNKSFVEVRVKDTGVGISQNNINQIFEEFYQVEQNINGTGIGLSLTKKLVELHKGTIKVESTVEKGSCFIVTLPLGSDHFSDSNIYELSENFSYREEENELNSLTSNSLLTNPEVKPNKLKSVKILLVEDNDELRNYLKECLENEYTIYEANDGFQGITKCLEVMPDLVISDVMMPNRNGLEMCSDIKNDIRISHIPVILLTARNSFEHKIEGFKTGADAYVVKPFNTRLLEVQIANILASRKELKIRFGNDVNMQPLEVSNSSADDAFLDKAIKIVEDHLIESEFDVEDFIKEIGMSRTSLHLKLKALTNQSTTEFIRSIRLKKAAIFLKQTNDTVAEIAYKTGFASPAYFSKCFKKVFGILPTDYRN